MKTNRSINLIAVAFSFAAFSATGCAEKEKTADSPTPPAKPAPATTAMTAKTEPISTAPSSGTVIPAVASARWIDIKDCTYDTRASFFVGLQQLEARVDGQISELTAQRAAMTSTTDTKAWDFAMKEMGDARSYLKSVGEELSKASAETWNQQKDTVGLAWVRTQEAYDKVKTSTTN